MDLSEGGRWQILQKGDGDPFSDSICLNYMYLLLMPLVAQSNSTNPLPGFEGLSRREIVDSVFELIDAGFLQYEFRSDKDGMPIAVRYRLTIPDDPRIPPWENIEIIRPN